ncbi:hypothetical protein [Haladaptatus sp. R4]|uniref:hypothetical protein n=1 Tax=Haladaptatus sp. R4 TaxID=1679489 RepID=UPI001CBC856C|nr:hypothetical protein [Haladaptatus sp. R4]
MASPSERRTPNGWPEPTPEQVQVMLLGTYHMDNPGLDEVNVDADDVLASHRQAELRELVTRIAEWTPDLITVERPYDRNDVLNDRYREYWSGERAYDHEETFPALHPVATNRRPNAEAKSCRWHFDSRLDSTTNELPR